MNFDHSEKVLELRERVETFMDEHVYPNEKTYADQLAEATARGERWSIPPVIEEMKEEAKARGLWNLFLPDSERSFSLKAWAKRASRPRSPKTRPLPHTKRNRPACN